MNPELLALIQANGGVMPTQAQLLLNTQSWGSLRTNGTLRQDEWKVLDTAIIKAAQDRLVGYADVLSAGLRKTLMNGLGTSVIESENVSDMQDAELTMDGVTRARNDAVKYATVGLPLPFIQKEYQISIRKLASSRNRGESLDATQAMLSSTKVADKQEDILFNGTSLFKYAGYIIYGYTDYTDRNTVTLSENWDAAGKTGAEIVDDVLNMKQASMDAKKYGPWNLYIPSAYETKMDEDYSTAKGSNTIRQRILAIEGINSVKVADKLTANNVVMVQMSEDVIRIVEGLPLTNVEWESKGSTIFHFKVMTISVPEIRSDQDGNCGVTHLAA